MAQITSITRRIKNGMYSNKYTVKYSNGYHREYTINGEMNDKHFNYMMNAKCERLEYKGAHIADRFTA